MSATPTPSPPESARIVGVEVYTHDELEAIHESLKVVGESHYQDALWAIVGGRRREHVRYETEATLIPDPDNVHDPNAVEVQIDGQLVGYLSRKGAALYGPLIRELVAANGSQYVTVPASIVGGGERRDGLGYLGVFIDFDRAAFGITP